MTNFSIDITGYLADDSATVFGYFVFKRDASDQDIGVVLKQVQDGEEKVVAYYSQSLTKQERNYCVTQKELLAVIAAVRHFHQYPYGRHFLIRTDHGAL